MSKAILIIVIAILVMAVAAYFMFFNNPIAPVPSGFDDTKVTKFVRLYLGLVDVSIEGKEWKNNEWIINISAKGSTGTQRFELRSDSNLSSFKAFGIVNVPNNPPTYQELNGANCKADKSVLDIFVDPYDPWSRSYFDTMNSISDKFSDSAVKKFYVINSYTSKLADYKTAVMASQYLVCAKNDSDSAFIKMARCVFARVNETGNILNVSELDNCSSTLGIQMSNESWKKCLENDSIYLLTSDGNYALTEMGEISTSYVIINCKYETFPTYLDVVLCHLYPDIPICKEIS